MKDKVRVNMTVAILQSVLDSRRGRNAGWVESDF